MTETYIKSAVKTVASKTLREEIQKEIQKKDPDINVAKAIMKDNQNKQS